MGRPTIALEDRRDIQLHVRVNLGEFVRLDQHAALAGVSVAELMRRRGLEELRLPTRRQADTLAATALIGLGNLLNQIARSLHRGRGIPLPALDALLSRINTELDRLYGPGDQHRGPDL